jgi:hypothetical protein
MISASSTISASASNQIPGTVPHHGEAPTSSGDTPRLPISIPVTPGITRTHPVAQGGWSHIRQVITEFFTPCRRSALRVHEESRRNSFSSSSQPLTGSNASSLRRSIESINDHVAPSSIGTSENTQASPITTARTVQHGSFEEGFPRVPLSHPSAGEASSIPPQSKSSDVSTMPLPSNAATSAKNDRRNSTASLLAPATTQSVHRRSASTESLLGSDLNAMPLKTDFPPVLATLNLGIGYTGQIMTMGSMVFLDDAQFYSRGQDNVVRRYPTVSSHDLGHLVNALKNAVIYDGTGSSIKRLAHYDVVDGSVMYRVDEAGISPSHKKNQWQAYEYSDGRLLVPQPTLWGCTHATQVSLLLHHGVPFEDAIKGMDCEEMRETEDMVDALSQRTGVSPVVVVGYLSDVESKSRFVREVHDKIVEYGRPCALDRMGHLSMLYRLELDDNDSVLEAEVFDPLHVTLFITPDSPELWACSRGAILTEPSWDKTITAIFLPPASAGSNADSNA